MPLTFRNRMWFMGGWYNGRLPGHSASNQVWSSRMASTGLRETDQAGWSPRLASSIVEHRGRMWILGVRKIITSEMPPVSRTMSGSRRTAGTGGKPPRGLPGNHGRITRRLSCRIASIYLFGGGNYVPEYAAWNDVWSSADGVEWRLETAHAPWPARLWFPAVVYRDHIWVLGGWSGEPATNRNDVWYSKNGRDWSRLETESIWKERHEHSAFVFQDCLWIAGWA
ncbi:MAG: hypothetical protein R3C12_03065 [Planctomycetaceae bacterium]